MKSVKLLPFTSAVIKVELPLVRTASLKRKKNLFEEKIRFSLTLSKQLTNHTSEIKGL